jgi:four helix bundle protein
VKTHADFDVMDGTLRDHRNLDAFKLAHTLILLVYRVTRDFPRDELYGITSQMRRSAVSAATNIVEGYGRRSDADRFRFLDIAFGSIREIGYYIELSHDLGFLHRNRMKELTQIQGRTAAALAGLIKTRKTG